MLAKNSLWTALAIMIGTSGCTAGFSELCQQTETCLAEAGDTGAPAIALATGPEACAERGGRRGDDAAADHWSDVPLDAPSAADGSLAARDATIRSGVDGGSNIDTSDGPPGDGGTPATGSSPGTHTDASVCDPTKEPKDDRCVLDEAYGVFVVPPEIIDAGMAGAADGGAEAGVFAIGSRSHPYGSISQALAQMGTLKARIYVCNGFYSDVLRIRVPVSLYGGLACVGGPTGLVWSYVGGAAQVQSAPDYRQSYPLVVDAVPGPVTIEDFSFSALPPYPDLIPGWSSVAALVRSSTVNLVRVSLSASTGSPGSPATLPSLGSNYTGYAPSGGPQVFPPGQPFAASPGTGAVNVCLLFGRSAGGDGGFGCTTGLGTPGTATPAAPVTQPGRDGLPRGTALPGGGTVPGDDPGADGLAGNGGLPATTYGTLLPSGIWMTSSGGDGATGGPGQGGAGASDPLLGACGALTFSVGGGGGGAGGCGGSGGGGGPGGGASIALIAFNAYVDFQECTLRTHDGAPGTVGGAGQDGQAGGVGGNTSAADGSFAASSGQAGGHGAGGSGGAGGTGGLSVGVLQLPGGGQVNFDVATTQNISLGAPGSGGLGGQRGYGATSGVDDGNPGAPGRAGASAVHLLAM